ncbi:MAG TPA: TIGR04211 family SH3 domain-containing protein [Gammaproteobacteria bacterium]|nr:TIGR04211 family SH3 domain-containing protein [Gammaproteobacteria bacterium]
MLLLCAVAGLAQAETRYVSDQLEITLRTGTSTSHSIVKMLKSGTPLQVLQTDPNTGYTQVRTPDGTEGWVLSRFLMDSPAARDQLAAAQKKVAELNLQDRKATNAYNELKSRNQDLTDQVNKLKEKNGQIAQQLSEIRRTASNALAIDSENKELKSKLLSLQRDLQSVRQENESLKDRTARDWFMVGAGVVILGIVIGLILPRIRVRKRSSWDSL